MEKILIGLALTIIFWFLSYLMSKADACTKSGTFIERVVNALVYAFGIAAVVSLVYTILLILP